MKKKLSILLFAAWLTLFSLGQTPDWEWATSAQGLNNDVGRCITRDTKGNIYVAGYFNGDHVQFGGITLQAPAGGMFIVKYDPLGNVIWGGTDAGNTHADVLSIAADANDNVYVAGTFFGASLSFGNITLHNATPGFFDTYLAKFDSHGNVLWAKSCNGLDMDIPWGIAVDNAGNIYLTGGFISSSINFSGVVLNNSSYPNIKDMFLVKYDTDGNVIWAKRGESHNCYNEGSGVAVDNAGNIYVTGYFTGDTNYGEFISFGNTVLSPFGGDTPNYFLVKYNSSGDVLWAKGTDYTTGGAYGNALTVDKWGNVYVVGEFSGDAIRFGNSDLVNAGGDYGNRSDVFITKYDPSGQVNWAKRFGSAGNDDATATSIDANGNLYVAGSFTNDNIIIGNVVISNSNPGTSDIIIVKCDPSGNYLRAKSAGGTDYDGASGICSDPYNNVYITGSFVSNIEFGNIILNSTGGSDFFMAKLGFSLAPLPLTWGSFTAEKIDKSVLLKWNTLQETNTSHFVIERGGTGNTFLQIGTVKAAGNGSSSNSYQFSDAFPLEGTNFYRLKQVDIDGKYEYSKICSVNFNNVYSTAWVFPNPVYQSAIISYSIQQDSKVSIKIYDVNGRQVKTLVNKEELAGTRQVQWNVTDEKGNTVPAGIYFLKVQAGNYSETKKLNVVK